MNKTAKNKALRLSGETIRRMTHTQISMVHGGMTNENGSQRCSQVPSCLTNPDCGGPGGGGPSGSPACTTNTSGTSVGCPTA
jgi:hypothetical protein